MGSPALLAASARVNVPTTLISISSPVMRPSNSMRLCMENGRLKRVALFDKKRSITNWPGCAFLYSSLQEIPIL
jgi:hypothetical protein